MLNSLKSALFTALWTFVGTTALLSVGWLQSLAGWASSNGHAPLPGLSTIGYAVIGALVSASSGLVAFIVRTAQAQNVIPGSPPAFGQTAEQTAAVSAVNAAPGPAPALVPVPADLAATSGLPIVPGPATPAAPAPATFDPAVITRAQETAQYVKDLFSAVALLKDAVNAGPAPVEPAAQDAPPATTS